MTRYQTEALWQEYARIMSRMGSRWAWWGRAPWVRRR
jgi:hypothetical protein